MGIAFLGLVGVWALIQGDVVGDGDVRWLLPVPWVLAGLAGLLALALSGSASTTRRPAGWATPETTTDGDRLTADALPKPPGPLRATTVTRRGAA